jgi:hypothetical protein
MPNPRTGPTGGEAKNQQHQRPPIIPTPNDQNAALERARRESPHARCEVVEMNAAQRWHFRWKREHGFDPMAVGLSTAQVDNLGRRGAA